nr:MAG TPA: hypothetical protein [Bacteriophage sp.]
MRLLEKCRYQLIFRINLVQGTGLSRLRLTKKSLGEWKPSKKTLACRYGIKVFQ